MLRNRKEAYTRTQFLDPTLHDLGWRFIPEQDLPAATITRKRPDYCLFANEQAQQRAANQEHSLDLFRESASVLEAKKVGHSLDRVSEEETPGWYPNQQLQDYWKPTSLFTSPTRGNSVRWRTSASFWLSSGRKPSSVSRAVACSTTSARTH